MIHYHHQIFVQLLGCTLCLKPSKSSRCIKASFYIPEYRLNFKNENFHETGLPINCNFLYFFIHIKSSSSTTSRELQLQSRLVADEDDNGKLLACELILKFAVWLKENVFRNTLLAQYWSILGHHWVNVLCLLGTSLFWHYTIIVYCILFNVTYLF